jgi:PAS domain S-box-containing protein
LRASEERYRSIIDSAVDAIIVIDRRGRVEAFNAAAERLFGYAAKDVLGRNVNMLMPQPYHGEHDQYMARYLTTVRSASSASVARSRPGAGRDDVSGPSVGRPNDDRRRDRSSRGSCTI